MCIIYLQMYDKQKIVHYFHNYNATHVCVEIRIDCILHVRVYNTRNDGDSHV